MTPDASGWRSSERYAHVADMTASDVAWEWLRRNEYYDKDFQALADSKDDPRVPDLAAGCSLADGCPADAFAAFVDEQRALHPGLVVVSYVNTSAAVKALSDVICTSSNAVEIEKHFHDRPVLFAPDPYLPARVGKEAQRPDLIARVSE